MSVVVCSIPFHGEWSEKKRVDAYFRKVQRMYWRTPIERVEFKERLRDPLVPRHSTRGRELLLGMYMWDEKVLFLNPMGRYDGRLHDVGKIFLHELLHKLDTKAGERTITKREKWLWSSFTGDQRNYLYICLFAKLKQPMRGIRIKATIPRNRRV
ncbi:MAG: hypothetical protein A3J55_00795 [Candidatus Ryanbacteria bacterium RIFCSPHIGHO2_02_FULL_45_17b]|uniref:Uncharacterized protein n=1 Tax=Candidatus Ryanbacteria bacterium RIFCSPHIGHO2_01_FULL_45_22 TaxID=1802114 RepID=A0A1G2G0T8_9BACT|nr:MAG: hypothetical protein A2719_03260 [Candidatus Ryanbacteria bacterium RIFCSPHIGHO2_01_FULL_45_22]OGZ47080.1 MAG: hypothetical protein A3J55_00795 [Candidatus Ryanbacteria bacterium RIFCSPHIGHO2_02_FULL_45_17b]